MKSPRSGPPRLEETKRIGRILRILRLIDAQPRQWTRARLATEMGVSERAIDNDLQLIRHSLRHELRRAAGGYFFADGPVTKPVTLSIPELLALSLAAQTARDTGSVDPVTIASALAHLEVALPSQLLPYLRRVAAEEAAAVVAPAVPRGPTLTILEQAMAEGRAVDMAYRSASRGDALSERRIRPYRLVPYDNSWQVIAHDSRRRAVRMFKVDRIESCVLTEERFEVPAHFDVDAYLGDTWGILRGEGGQAEDISLVFTRTAAAWVRDERRHPSQSAERLPGHGIRVCFHATVTHELVRWVLSFGGEVTVERPATLRDRVVEEAWGVVREATSAGRQIK